jgi:hypothetical protein
VRREWILVVDVAPVKLAVLNFFDLVLGVGTATEDLGAFRPSGRPQRA